MAGRHCWLGHSVPEPAVPWAMIAMLGIFALSLVDFITLPIPAFAQRLTGQARPAGHQSPSLRSDFMAGMLATILATPCSAPFVGTAVAAALSGSVAGMFGIFLAMGFGLAAPWLVVAAFPSLVGFLPRPGGLDGLAEADHGALLLGTMIVAWHGAGRTLSPRNLPPGDDAARTGSNWSTLCRNGPPCG